MDAGPRAWLTACILAELVGMTTAAAAARGANQLAPGVAALLVVVAGGLVEGTALGVLQGRVVGARFGTAVRAPWAVGTVAIAGLGWAAASAPSALDDGAAGTEMARWLVLLGAAGLGLAMGVLLGLVQAVALRRGGVEPVRRWVVGSTVGWTLAMPVVFVGATLPEAGWSTVAVVVTGSATGAAAGALLGLVTWPFLSGLAALDRRPSP